MSGGREKHTSGKYAADSSKNLKFIADHLRFEFALYRYYSIFRHIQVARRGYHEKRRNIFKNRGCVLYVAQGHSFQLPLPTRAPP